jgi:acid phosphatase (class A)
MYADRVVMDHLLNAAVEENNVVAGPAIAGAAVAGLHTNKTFLADLAAAKNEFRAVRGSGPSAEVDCSAEAEAFGL